MDPPSTLLSLLYSRLARARRRYYEHRPHLRRRLAAPVISVGNLTVGGSGKTPLAAEIARMLIEMGERPSILSRGYARKIFREGVVVVSDGSRVLEAVEHSGDEPQMLARAVPRAAVLVSSSRYAAGRIAESRLGCTVHVLDDGFQHFDLMRDVDLLVAHDESESPRTLPFGRLREPLDAAAAADALLVETVAQDFSPVSSQSDRAEAMSHQTAVSSAARLNVPVAFTFSRRLGGPLPDRPAFAFAGIAKPQRFFGDLEKAGWKLNGRRSFGDHHHFSVPELEEIERAAMSSGAGLILTTEKDFVRLGSAPRPGTGVRPPNVAVPLEVAIEPAQAPWLAERLRAVRAQGAK
jgi:tetraacyldisaccharide 4'-kinase